MRLQQTTERLNHSFAISGVVTFEPGDGDLTRIAVTSPLATAQIYLQGAHLTQFQPIDSDPVLFLSAKSVCKPGKAIRGGVPVIFPWFGPRSDGLMHGFVRTRTWDVRSVTQQSEQSIDIVFATRDNDETREIWPHAFEAEMRFSIGRELSITFAVKNNSDHAFSFENALHTYYAVSDVRQVALHGLRGVEYLDKNLVMKRLKQTASEIRPSGAMDRVYVNSTTVLAIYDPGLARRIAVESHGSRTTVVWNPWSDNMANFADLLADDWTRFLCVETANAKDNALTLPPGEVHETNAVVRVEPIA